MRQQQQQQFTIKKATRYQVKLRLALVGPSGTGKTFSALQQATALGQKILVIDSENGSSRLYAHKFDFDLIVLESYDPRNYIQAILQGEKAGYDVIIIDSLSHAWNGTGGALELVDRFNSEKQHTGWQKVTPIQNQLTETINSSPCHIIVTMRAKEKVEMVTNDRGKQVPQKMGLGAIQRDGIGYEFTLVLNLDHALMAITDKSRLDDHLPAGTSFDLLTQSSDLSRCLLEFIGEGEPAPIEPEIDLNADYDDLMAMHAFLLEDFPRSRQLGPLEDEIRRQHKERQRNQRQASPAQAPEQHEQRPQEQRQAAAPSHPQDNPGKPPGTLVKSILDLAEHKYGRDWQQQLAVLCNGRKVKELKHTEAVELQNKLRAA